MKRRWQMKRSGWSHHVPYYGASKYMSADLGGSGLQCGGTDHFKLGGGF